MPGFDLGREARSFADKLSSLLNRTVCTGVRLAAVTDVFGRVVVGHRISKDDLDPRIGIPLALGNRKPACYVGLSYRLTTDDAGKHLMVISSIAGVFADEALNETVVHYDYERDKEHGYPDAHLQVGGECPAWDTIRERRSLPPRPFDRVHFPVGGRRFRPTLEDLIEFVITEGLADHREGALTALEDERREFQMLQLRAAVRRNPDVALEVLRAEGLLPGQA